jgi:hypothetical protein
LYVEGKWLFGEEGIGVEKPMEFAGEVKLRLMTVGEVKGFGEGDGGLIGKWHVIMDVPGSCNRAASSQLRAQ